MKRIKLTKRKWALVDDEDYAWLSQFKWCASLESRGTKYYAIRWEYVWKQIAPGIRERSRVKVRMHRLVMGLPPGKDDPRVVDHLNHNSLDNRKANLEVITQAENMVRSPGWRKKAVLSPETDDDFSGEQVYL